MTTLADLKLYKRLPEWTADNLPPGFRKPHNTMAGTWGKLTILAGEIKYYALSSDSGAESDIEATYVFSPDNPPPLVEPQAWHMVEPLTDDLRCYVEFYCEPDQYYKKKYSLSAPHSEVVEVLNHVSSGSALDLGCGRGRNSLFLQSKGFQVECFDKNPEAIAKLHGIIDQENLGGSIAARVDNLEHVWLSGSFDLVLSTVVFQFLNPDAVPSVVTKMQEVTKPGGYNLIVGPMSTPDLPCPLNLPFTFKEGELERYYEGWDIVKYNENIGEFHRKDEAGNNLKCKFATLAARRKS